MTSSRNWRRESTPFSDAGFWYVCHANLWPDSSGTKNRRRLEHCSISKPETAVRVTEVTTYRRLLFISVISCKKVQIVVLLIVIHRLRRLRPRLFLCQKFSFRSPDVCGTKNRRRKSAPENGVDLWHRFLERVPWVWSFYCFFIVPVFVISLPLLGE